MLSESKRFLVTFLNVCLLGVFTDKSCSKSLGRNSVYIESRDVNEVKINMALYNLIGRQRCSAVSRKTACKCFTASILALI